MCSPDSERSFTTATFHPHLGYCLSVPSLKTETAMRVASIAISVASNPSKVDVRSEQPAGCTSALSEYGGSGTELSPYNAIWMQCQHPKPLAGSMQATSPP